MLTHYCFSACIVLIYVQHFQCFHKLQWKQRIQSCFHVKGNLIFNSLSFVNLLMKKIFTSFAKFRILPGIVLTFSS